ncbi:MAG: TRAP transporter small permease [Rhodospirillales bacterium]|nr:MAG: TRAP transporter small permease [Rhodospirillales bacterium]
MATLARVRQIYERLLEAVTIFLMIALTAVVVVAVVYRKAGASLVWYDEVASIMLAWLTYYCAALAALKRNHIGFEGIIEAVPPRLGLVFLAASEIVIFAFFGLLAWVGVLVLQVLEGDTLVSLPQVPVQLTQSVIPIGAVLFMIGEALSLPETWRRVRDGRKLHDEVGSGPPNAGAAQGSPGP